ncbi:MAG: hypothetical protein JWQ09_2166, partial [Segetibacter sp.]|nr:hypothetical protein [Segetibacter sp.]
CTNPTGSATVNETGGTTPYTYLWKPGNQTDATVSGLAAGDYVVYVYDKNKCADSAHIKITSTAGLTVTIANISNVTCSGGNNGSATANAIGTSPYSFTWSPAGGNGQTASDLPAGNYTVSVIDQQGCTATATTQIAEPARITTQITAVATTCGNNNGSASVMVSGGTGNYTYSWQPGNYTGASINNVAAGTYTLTVKDANGCTRTDEVIIKRSSMVAIAGIIPSDVLCNGQLNGAATATVVAGTAPYSYKWSNGAVSYTGNPLQNVASGSYRLTVTDSAGCVATSDVTINQPAPLAHAVNIIPATCGTPNGSATVTESGGTAPYIYTWSPSGENGPSTTNLSKGDYISYITDSHQCTDSVYIHITNLGGVSATITDTKDVTCYGDNNGSATVSAAGVLPPFTYAWSAGGGTTATANNLTAGNYNVTVTDKQGCTATASTTIGEPTAIQTKVSNNNTTCNNSNGSATVVATSGAVPYTYTWMPGNYTSSTISNLAAAHYWVTVTDSHGCSKIDSAVIAPSTNPVIDSIIHTDISCFAKQDGTALAKVSRGTAPYKFAWTTGSSTFTTERIQNLPAGNYHLKVTDVTGCTTSGNTAIAEPEALQLSVATVHTTCGSDNGSAALNASGGITPYRYQWSTGSSENTITNISAGAYHVKCTDANGCIATANDVKINSSFPIRISLGNDTSICPGNEVLLNPGRFKNYTWQDNSHNATFKAVQKGVYTVSVIDSIGCTASASVKVDINCNDIVFPDAFTPNGDGHNDAFGPLGTLPAVKDYTLTIYSRWGQAIFSSSNPYKKWDGKFNALDIGTGAFVWIATYSFNGQPKRLQKGTIIAIK